MPRTPLVTGAHQVPARHTALLSNRLTPLVLGWTVLPSHRWVDRLSCRAIVPVRLYPLVSRVIRLDHLQVRCTVLLSRQCVLWAKRAVFPAEQARGQTVDPVSPV